MGSATPLLRRARKCSIRSLLFIFFAVATIAAQTVRPLLVEYKNVAHGRIELVNDSTTPLTVVISPKSFHVSETGQVSYSPLDSSIHLKLSAMSFRIPPQQSYYVFYEAKADKLPAWFVIYCEFAGYPLRDRSGLNVQVELPHTVYLLPRQSMRRTEVKVEAHYDAAQNRVEVEAQNTGNSFGRVQFVDLVAGRTHKEEFGFPMFPNSTRKLNLSWDKEGIPEKVVLRLNEFSVETPIR